MRKDTKFTEKYRYLCKCKKMNNDVLLRVYIYRARDIISIDMIKIGQYNTLKVDHLADFGAYLDAGDGTTILMPAKYFPFDETPKVGDEVDVFVYNDSEDRLVATTEHPYAMVGEFAFLEVTQVNRVGAFLDWGIESKDLLVPFSEQKADMKEGGVYLVYVYLDNATKRIVASQKVEKFLGNVLPEYRQGQQVQALVCQHTPIGYKCIVDNLHYGMIYDNEVFKPIELEQTIVAYVKNVREDGKIDLTIGAAARERTGDLASQIMDRLRAEGGEIGLGDKSAPEDIKGAFLCSKKDFKKAVGKLYKARKITVEPYKIKLL